MGVDVPDLDDREFEEFLEDARSRIPVHSDSWTDHNAHDPGITFLELFAWIAETDDYRLDRVTDEHIEQYLRLVDVQPHPPTRATARVAVSVPDDLNGAVVRDREPLRADVSPSSVERFRARGRTELTSATVDAVISVHRAGRSDDTVANESAEMSFRAFGDDPAADDALYLGFQSDPFAAVSRLNLDIEYDDADLPDPATHGDEIGRFEPSHRVVWEYYVTPTDEDQRDGSWFDDTRWQAFADTVSETAVRDGTTALYESGCVSLPEPPDWPSTPATFFGGNDPHYWVRGRLAQCEPPGPSPACDAPDGSSEVPQVHYEIPPQLSAVRTNVFEVEHASMATSVDCETLDQPDTVTLKRHGGPTTTARPRQRFHFDRAPVQTATITVGGQPWDEVPDFAGSGPDDRHYVLNRANGVVRFGNGVQGAIPEPDQDVIATDCEFGGGDDGNVPASTEWRFECGLLANDVAIEPLGSASGGSDAESVDAALARATESQDTPFRTVTQADYSYVATHTPGLRFGRAKVLTGGTDREPADPIRVVVVPFSPPDVRPYPSAGFLEAVDCHLKRHALLTDDVTAVTPTYVDVKVEADIRIVEGTLPEARRRACETAVREFLDPLRGFEGDGWPFGRPVYVSEIYELLEETEGVDTVVDVDVATEDGTDSDRDTALPALEAVTVRILEEPEDCGREF
ncbi:putative baseplate assembly protein [Haloarcula mannanilytica]|uniref:Putative baseplate assembly protein n=1 Tax=Haloarcula mannanilytica TaxID=2509225 RepID=A0A4C2ELV8_9EURY|nr:putative baseplate assembly protein [Haloarcula mannanilytica]GCF15375.1 putative baseplate assembly protein [Haloarcula mannanilytica]